DRACPRRSIDTRAASRARVRTRPPARAGAGANGRCVPAGPWCRGPYRVRATCCGSSAQNALYKGTLGHTENGGKIYFRFHPASTRFYGVLSVSTSVYRVLYKYSDIFDGRRNGQPSAGSKAKVGAEGTHSRSTSSEVFSAPAAAAPSRSPAASYN